MTRLNLLSAVSGVDLKIANGKLASAGPDTYPFGSSTATVTLANGWPSTGMVITNVQEATRGYSSQLLISRLADSVPVQLYTRSSASDGLSWNAWQRVSTAPAGSKSLLDYSNLAANGNWTTAINTALTEAGTAPVFVPPGTYDCADLVIPANGSLVGDGGATLRLIAGSSGRLATLAASSTLRDLRLDGNMANQSATSSMLVVAQGERATLRNLHASAVRHRSFVLEQAAKFSRVSGCSVSDSGAIDSCDAFVIKASDAMLSDLAVYRHGNGHGFRFGRFTSDPAVDCTNVVGTNLLVDTSQHNGFTFEVGARYITLSSITVRNAPQACKGEDASHISLVGGTFENISLSTAFNMALVPYSTYSGLILRNSGGGYLIGNGSVIEGCIAEDLVNATSNISAIAASNGPAAIIGNTLRNCKGGIPISAPSGGRIVGNELDSCDNNASDYQILCGNNATTVQGGHVGGNIVRNPLNTGGGRLVTVIGLWGSRMTAVGNVLVGTAARGVRVIVGSNYYSVHGNVMTGATTPIMDSGGVNSSVTSGAGEVAGTWYTPTLLNGWVQHTSVGTNQNTPVGHTKRGDVVYLRGLIRSGTMGVDTPMFTLPAGYRPAFQMHIATSANNTYASLGVQANGDVVYKGGSNAWFSLDGISFIAEG